MEDAVVTNRQVSFAEAVLAYMGSADEQEDLVNEAAMAAAGGVE